MSKYRFFFDKPMFITVCVDKRARQNPWANILINHTLNDWEKGICRHRSPLILQDRFWPNPAVHAQHSRWPG